ncbi:EcsC family protein [Flavobacterium litorale]|uniref:EcsC family protein n=1 Tax=Flavobacterium litorale TaxID=2856519 RepID=A0ABX8V631_9FLAO|nr:EcsC family protein [Flavobacterium litorale]QYJ68299.1 EcsC family protein [Flavobacterium litorale]
MDFNKLIHKVTPAYHNVKQNVYKLRYTNAGKPANELSQLYIKRIRNKYTSVGAVTALPGIIPGLGTATQFAVEASSVSADLILMLRWMASICYGTALIYGKDIEKEFENEFATVLGIWSGVLKDDNAVMVKSSAITTSHFNKHINDKLKNRINQKIGQKLIAQYGGKRGTAALGKFIPFGVGAVVGGAFNYTTMKSFGRVADNYFKSYKNTIYHT